MDVSATALAAILASAASVLTAVITGFFVTGRMSEQLRNLGAKLAENERKIAAVEASTGPIVTLFTAAEVSKMPERLVRFESTLSETNKNIQSFSQGLKELVTREELAATRRELKANFGNLHKSIRYLLRRTGRNNEDIAALLTGADMHERLACRQQESERDNLVEEDDFDPSDSSPDIGGGRNKHKG